MAKVIEMTIEQLKSVVIKSGTTDSTVDKTSTGKVHNLTFDWTGVDGKYLLYALTDHAKTLRINRKIDDAARDEGNGYKRKSKDGKMVEMTEAAVEDAKRYLETDITVSVKKDIVDVQKGNVDPEKLKKDLRKGVNTLISKGMTKAEALEMLFGDQE